MDTLKNNLINTYQLFLSLVLIIFLSFIVVSQATAFQSKYKAQTTNDVYVPIDELQFSLTPLSIEESKIEVEAWTLVLKRHVRLVSEAEIMLSQKQKHIQAAQNLADMSEERAEAFKKEQKSIAHKKEVKENYEKLIAEVDKLSEDEAQKEAVKEMISNESSDSESSHALAEKAEKYSEKLVTKRSLLINNLTLLREQKNDLLERYLIVLDNWEAKGGDAKLNRLYVDAVSDTTTVDLTDGNTAWLTMKGWMWSKDGGVFWLTRFIKFTLALLFVYLVSLFVGKVADAALSLNHKISSLLKEFIQTSARRVVLGIGFLMSLTIIEVNVGPVLALIGAAGLVIGLALQSTLSNFASGMLILIYRPFDVGDVIEINGSSGFVHSMTLLSTMIKTYDNQHLIVPNNSVWGSTIVNVTGSLTRRVDLVFGIGYSDDMEKARQIMVDVLEKHPAVLKKPEYMVKVHELGDSSVNFICRPWVKTSDYWDVYWDVTLQVKEQFDLQGITIPFPQRDVHLHNVQAEQPKLQESKVAIPQAHETQASKVAGTKSNVPRGDVPKSSESKDDDSEA
ncbi:MAG: mechanosensitive ion channel domain-containing protein [Colwellia sp.]